MKNLGMETLIFFAKEVVVSMRKSHLKIKLVESIGENLYQEILEYVEENNEVTKEELELLTCYKIIFTYSAEERIIGDDILLEIKEGTSYYHQNVDSLVEKMVSDCLIEKQDVIRYLAHNNHYHQVLEICNTDEQLLGIAKKYGSQRTRINFVNYETMKKLQDKLVPLGKKEKKEKI